MQLTIERMVYGPDGLAHTPEGKTVFVAGALAGDTVEAHVVSEENSLVRAVADRIVEPSPERVDTPCPFVGACGGCPWGGLSRTAQRAAKEENLKSALERIGGFERAEVEELVAPAALQQGRLGLPQQDRARTHHGRRRQDVPRYARARPPPDHPYGPLPAL